MARTLANTEMNVKHKAMMFTSLLPSLLAVAAVMLAMSSVDAETPGSNDADLLVKKIQQTIAGPIPKTLEVVPPRGEFLHGSINDSTIYPGTENGFQVYIPAEYDPAKPACLLVKLDGLGNYEASVLDDLIAKKQVPVIIGLGISSGTITKEPTAHEKRQVVRFNRSYEFDSTNDNFPNYVLNELLPTVAKMKTRDGRAINISPDGNDHAATGASTGGIGSFTLAWRRPDQFTRVFSSIGTFVSMRGGHEYPALVRKTDPKPIRIFLEDGSVDTWNPLFGSWFDANVNLESALTFAGYDVAHAWGTHGHDSHPGQVIFPDVMRWLWRDYPAPIKPGISQNNLLQEISVPGEGWEKVPHAFQSANGLAANSRGEVYLTDASIILDSSFKPFIEHGPAITAQTFGPDGTLYGLVPSEKKVVSIDVKSGMVRTIAEGIAGHSIVVTHDSRVYVTEPGEHSDMPSKIWQIKPNGENLVVDQGLSTATGIAFSPDGSLFYAAESSTKWIYSYLVKPDGTVIDKQAFYWLHMTDIPNNSGTEDLVVDRHGNLYAATRMGVQVCDQNGRVRAILPLPTPCGAATSLCFGGEHFDVLYITDGKQLFKRKMKLPGLPPWSAPIQFPSQGGG